MRFGFHVSIGSGFPKAVAKAVETNCDTIQIFSHNPRGWSGRDLDPAEADAFREAAGNNGINPVIVHMPYLPNLAAADADLYEKSVLLLVDDLKRACLLGASFLVTHIGHRGNASEEEGLRKVARALDRAFSSVHNSVMLLLENSAGQGSEIGCTFGHLKKIIHMTETKNRMGICLDTAHAFAAGYDIATKDGLEKTLSDFDQTIGIERLMLLHLNDSKTPCASRVDRHWHIGRGCIGIEGFRYIVNHPFLSAVPAIMETPKKTDSDDFKNMKTVRSLVAKQKIP